MLYTKNSAPKLSDELFKNPTAEYRGTPFWAWNGRLDEETLREQIRIFKEMGLGGFHMHVRTGLQDPYLTESFMKAIGVCVDEAKKQEMLAYLYDEDRWPSGSAGGLVTAEKAEDGHRKYARQSLLFTIEPYSPERPYKASKPEPGRGQGSIRQDNGDLLAVYDIRLDKQGRLEKADLLTAKTEEEAAKLPLEEGCIRWYAYREYATEDPWFNNFPYVDTLNPEAIRKFIDVTHEAYYREFADDFGKTIPSIFTDEPQIPRKKALDFAAETSDVFIAWTDAIPALFEKRFGTSLMARLPELFWERADGEKCTVRWQYQNLITDLFVESFCKQIGDWCQDHGISLTGHVMGEPTLYSQTMAVGDAMRCYKDFGIPGIDMLCDFHEYTTAKQTQSMVRQMGKEGMLSELYGVTGWDYDFRGYKLQGDWQAALGVTLRVPHLSWESMHGEAKRDYPASISYQSPWWKRYSIVENHFGRLNTALTRGKALCKVGVIHPIESYWLLWGPTDQMGAARDQMEKQFADLCETLLLNQMDFDYLDEGRLEELCSDQEGSGLKVGQMTYDAVVVPPVLTLRSSTVAILNDFIARGGRVLVQSEAPEYVNAEKTETAGVQSLYQKAEFAGTDPQRVLNMLEPCRFVDVREADGHRFGKMLYQHREDNGVEWLFLCNGENPVSPDVDPMPKLRFILSGEYKITEYDTLSGDIKPLKASLKNGKTVFERVWHSHDSLLLKLEPAKDVLPVESEAISIQGGVQTRFGLVDVALSEKNMLLFDEAEWRLNGGEWQPIEEILRIDNYARKKLGMVLRLKEVAQPYTIKPVKAVDKVALRFRFTSELEVKGAKLALEDAAVTAIKVNGVSVDNKTDGWFVDQCIGTVPLPDLKAGDNTIEVEVPIGPNTDLEYYYLLGDFSVRLRGTDKCLTAPITKLGFGDICMQELPFYTGNIDYKVNVVCQGDFAVRVPQYRGGLVEVLLDGEYAGDIVFSPYLLKIKADPGEHTVTFRLYGTRQNGFAQLHHTQGIYFYQSPNSWRSAGDLWSYEYRFKPAGILRSPEFIGADVVQADGSFRGPDYAVTTVEMS